MAKHRPLLERLAMELGVRRAGAKRELEAASLEQGPAKLPLDPGAHGHNVVEMGQQ